MRGPNEAVATDGAVDATDRRVLTDAARATSVPEVEAAIQTCFADAGCYRSALVGTYNPENMALACREPVEGTIEAASLVGDPGLVTQALESGDVTVRESDVPIDEGLSVAVVPLTPGETPGTVLALVSDRRDAFGTAERAVLEDLASALAEQLAPGSDSEPETDNRRFAAQLAHEVRGLVGTVSTNLRRARAEEDGADTDAYEEAQDALRRLEETVESVLSVAGEAALDEPHAGDLATDASEAWKSVTTDRATIDLDDPPEIRADHAAVRRLLANLFRNAVEHGTTADGDPAVALSAPPSGDRAEAGPASRQFTGGLYPPEPASSTPMPNGGTVEQPSSRTGSVTVRVGSLADGFYVEDDGPGIPPEKRDRVFEWGYARTESGAGLGLAIVREIAKAHGWEIDLTTSSDGGARFEVTGVETVAPDFEWGADA